MKKYSLMGAYTNNWCSGIPGNHVEGPDIVLAMPLEGSLVCTLYQRVFMTKQSMM
jgi:hypothetical protein